MLSLLWITWRIIAAILPADMLSTCLVDRLFLSLFVTHDALLCRTPILGLRHACLAAMLATHVLSAFQIVFFRHLKLR